LSEARRARHNDPRNIRQKRLAERRHSTIQICHRQGPCRTLILIHQSHPIVVTSMEKGIGPLRDQPYRFAHEVRQWPRRSEGNP